MSIIDSPLPDAFLLGRYVARWTLRDTATRRECRRLRPRPQTRSPERVKRKRASQNVGTIQVDQGLASVATRPIIGLEPFVYAPSREQALPAQLRRTISSLAFGNAVSNLCQQRNVALAAVTQDAQALWSADLTMCDKGQVALASIKRKGLAIAFVSERLRYAFAGYLC